MWYASKWSHRFCRLVVSAAPADTTPAGWPTYLDLPTNVVTYENTSGIADTLLAHHSLDFSCRSSS